MPEHFGWHRDKVANARKELEAARWLVAIKLPKNHFAYYLSVARPFTPAEVAGVRAKWGLAG